ncbi:EPIDERMAL PATTERNING FACTOR-like protein 6 [Tasmannia lanceolata]|uniref:EPIDERMAL PATTERNING FACTOR-like protein 6 n=1 Tax=Tasmannia lanceolata TaxID=3420 RepID=UPI00406413C3
MFMDLRTRHRLIPRTPLFYCCSICFFSVCAFLSTIPTTSSCLDIRSSFGRKIDCYNNQGNEAAVEEKEGGEISVWKQRRRYLNGLGSSPPRCTSKCGNCIPCKPVHVPVPPGTPVTTEYYPEAWRCKCGNKLYMP